MKKIQPIPELHRLHRGIHGVSSLLHLLLSGKSASDSIAWALSRAVHFSSSSSFDDRGALARYPRDVTPHGRPADDPSPEFSASLRTHKTRNRFVMRKPAARAHPPHVGQARRPQARGAGRAARRVAPHDSRSRGRCRAGAARATAAPAPGRGGDPAPRQEGAGREGTQREDDSGMH